MSNAEVHPDVELCETGSTAGGRIEIIEPRDVPLGGIRAMNVRRTLPARQRSLVGAWCFLDNYGPDDVTAPGAKNMDVAPHPHTGLATVSWLFSGTIEHRDSAGNHAIIRPGEVNLMMAGPGIAHSEVGTQETTILHGAQLWFALPDSVRHTLQPGLAHHVPTPVTGPGWEARVFLGALLGDRSPVPTPTSLLGVEFVLEPGAVARFAVDPSFEHAVLADTGSVTFGADTVVEELEEHLETVVTQHQLAYLAPGAGAFTLTAGPEPTRLLLLGGPPFGEQILMWWNFVGRTHEEIVEYRSEWTRQIRGSASDQSARGTEFVQDAQDMLPGQFGIVVGDHLPPIPAPELPKGVRLKLRG